MCIYYCIKWYDSVSTYFSTDPNVDDFNPKQIHKGLGLSCDSKWQMY